MRFYDRAYDDWKTHNPYEERMDRKAAFIEYYVESKLNDDYYPYTVENIFEYLYEDLPPEAKKVIADVLLTSTEVRAALYNYWYDRAYKEAEEEAKDIL